MGKIPSGPKRILYVEENMDGTIGGSHYCLLELVHGLNKNLFIPTVVFFQDNILIPEFKKLCPTHIFPKKRGLVIERDLPHVYNIPFLRPLLLLFQKTYNFLRYHLLDFFKILHLLITSKVDLVHLNNAPDLTDWLIASKMLRIKCTAHVRGHWEPNNIIQKTFAQYYDSIISISHSVTDHMRAKTTAGNNLITIHDGIDIDRVRALKHKEIDNIKKELGVANSDFLIAAVGNIKPWKGQHVAIEAIKILKEKHPHLKCFIIGDVSQSQEDKKYLNYLKNMVTPSLSKHVIFTGFRRNIPEVVSIMDILIHTSVAPEPLGRVILEGMVLSKPVIATAHGGPLDIIEDGISGFLVPPNDPMALAQKIEYLVEHPEVDEKIGAMAKKRVEEKFNLARSIKNIEALYAALLKE